MLHPAIRPHSEPLVNATVTVAIYFALAMAALLLAAYLLRRWRSDSRKPANK
jgi:hypothetical protein